MIIILHNRFCSKFMINFLAHLKSLIISDIVYMYVVPVNIHTLNRGVGNSRGMGRGRGRGHPKGNKVDLEMGGRRV